MPQARVVVLGPDDAFRARGFAELPVVVARRQVFPDGEQLIVVPDPEVIRDAHVVAVATTAFDQDRRLTTLYQLIEACAAWAAAVDVAVPYLAYGRQDRRTPDGAALSAALPIRVVGALGVGRVLTVDQHSSPAMAAVPVVDVPAAGELVHRLRTINVNATEVVSTDLGGTVRAARLAALLGLPSRSLTKHKDATGTRYDAMPPALHGSSVIVVDDLCTTGSTLVPLLDELAAIGCAVPAVAITHLLMDPADLAARLPGRPRLVYTDSAADHPAAAPVLPRLVAVWRDLSS